MSDLDRVREIFLADVDEETRAENLELITTWEKGLAQNRAFLEWQTSDVSIEIIAKLRATYREIAVTIAQNRQLTDADRQTLWARQDACLWLIQLIGQDAKGELERIDSEITKALNAT